MAFLKLFVFSFLFFTIGRSDKTNRTDQNNKNHHRYTVAFSAAKTKPLKGHKQKQFSLGFDHVFLNEGNYFDPNSGVFTAPFSGIYEFSFSGGALPHRKLSLQLMKNYFEVQTLAFDGHSKRNPHIQSQNIILELNVGERVWIRLASSRLYGVAGASGTSYVTTFTGRLLAHNEINIQEVDGIQLTGIENKRNFFYARSKRLTLPGQLVRSGHSNFPYAFSVAKTSSVFGRVTNSSYSGFSRNGAITYDKYFVNVGGTMDLLSGEFTTPTRGLYYFSYTVGKYPGMKLSVSLIKNENEFQVMVYDESLSNKRQMQSQSIILYLKEGDKIWLKSYNALGYAVYSNLGNYITFNGYLVSLL